MKIRFSRKAEKSLAKIFDHTKKNFSQDLALKILGTISQSITKLGEFPRLGQPIHRDPLRRKLVVEGNVVLYEILLTGDPSIVIRNLRPRRSGE